MKNMKSIWKDCRGMTLAELLIASVLATMIVVAGNSLSVMMFNAGNRIENEFLPMTQANLAVETIYQRVVRAPLMDNGAGVKVPFILQGSGGLVFSNENGSGQYKVDQSGDKVILTSADGSQQTLMHGVVPGGLQFSMTGGALPRLQISVKFNNGEGAAGGGGTKLGSLLSGFIGTAYAQNSTTDTSSVSSSVTPRTSLFGPNIVN